jgi:hypothetical protein
MKTIFTSAMILFGLVSLNQVSAQGTPADSTFGAWVNATDENALFACTGSADVQVWGGTAPYTYVTSDGQTTNPAVNLCAGIYTVVVTDANGLTTTLTYIITAFGGSYTNPIDSTYFPGDTTVWDTTGTPSYDDTLGTGVITDCIIDYSSIDSILITDYTVSGDSLINVIWTVYDSTGMTTIPVTYDLTFGYGLYEFLISIYCPLKSTSMFVKGSDHVLVKAAVASISEVNELQANVSPNPFSNAVNITTDKVDNYTITLFDMSGRNLVTESFKNTNTLKVSNLDNLSQGEYIIHIQSSTEVITRKLKK